MVLAYIRPDKNFITVHEQLQYINSYATSNNFVIDDEFVDQISQNKRLSERSHISHYFQSRKKATLLVYDVWVLTTDMEDLIQMFSCLLKNEFQVHFIKQTVIMTQDSSTMLTLGLMDQLRQTLQEESKKVIGRPKGSRSSSKFDVYINEIISYIKENKSVSEMARLLHVSRSSLKDYIESRELKEVAFGSLVHEIPIDAEEQVINTITCPK
jgi:DNA invertase Pin-like site-specific DNA recombinase